MQNSLSQSTTVDLDPSEQFSVDEIHVLPNSSNTSISFRFLRPGDQSEVKALCCDWFPLEYPDQWYDDIVHDNKYFSLAACETNTHRIVGVLVADIFCFGQCNREDQIILHKSFPYNTPVCYILILGVIKEYRRQGLASILLQNLITNLNKRATCKAIYLHVLFSNKQAIQFYQSKQFQYRAHLPHYYFIKGENQDGYTFVLYINGKKILFYEEIFLKFIFYLGGYPPFTISDLISNCWSYLIETSPCRLLGSFRDFLVNKFFWTNCHQHNSSHKQISRII